MKSGQQIDASNAQRFNDWIAERGATNDWDDYIRHGKLNRSEIANECGFALSVVRQNPAVKAALEALEARRLLDSGVIEPVKAVPSASSEAWSEATNQSIHRKEDHRRQGARLRRGQGVGGTERCIESRGARFAKPTQALPTLRRASVRHRKVATRMNDLSVKLRITSVRNG